MELCLLGDRRTFLDVRRLLRCHSKPLTTEVIACREVLSWIKERILVNGRNSFLGSFTTQSDSNTGTIDFSSDSTAAIAIDLAKMHIKLLCFVFPDDDEPALPALVDHEKGVNVSRQWRCRGHVFNFVKESLHRFLDSGWRVVMPNDGRVVVAKCLEIFEKTFVAGASGRGSSLSLESCQSPGLCSSQSALPSI
nr:receptor like protein kinase S.2 [Ipomoea batatas]